MVRIPQVSPENTVRTHDAFYASEGQDHPPKESFKFLAKRISEYKKTNKNQLVIADIGCAAGAFPAYLHKVFPQDTLLGFEYLEVLVKTAEKNFPALSFKQASVLEKNSIPGKSLDIITLLGVLSIFDEPERIFNNLLYWVKPNGKIFVHGMFNPFDFDVFLKYRNSQDYGINKFESGWNIISQKTIKNILQKNGIKDFVFHKFEMSVDLPRNQADFARSWTEKYADGRRFITNGLCLLQPQYILEIDT